MGIASRGYPVGKGGPNRSKGGWGRKQKQGRWGAWYVEAAVMQALVVQVIHHPRGQAAHPHRCIHASGRHPLQSQQLHAPLTYHAPGTPNTRLGRVRPFCSQILCMKPLSCLLSVHVPEPCTTACIIWRPPYFILGRAWTTCAVKDHSGCT